MYRPLSATWRFPVCGIFTKCYLFSLKDSQNVGLVPEIDSGTTACAEGRKKYQETIVQSNVSGCARAGIAKVQRFRPPQNHQNQWESMILHCKKHETR